MANIFRGGIPYGPDIRRLTERFPVPSLTEGRVITHAELENALDLKRGTSRYYSVVKSWVAKQKTDNAVILAWERFNGLRVLDPAGVLGFAETTTKQKARQFGRAVKLFEWVPRDRLDTTGQKRLDHHSMYLARVTQSVEQASRDLAIALAPVQSIPKRIA